MTAKVEETIKTGPYKWVRDLYAKVAAKHGVRHEFKFHKLPKGGNQQKTEYHQVISGPDAAVSAVERECDELRAEIETATRNKFPGVKMFTKPANAYREKMVKDIK